MTNVFTVTASHNTMMGQLECRMTKRVNVYGEEQARQLVDALGKRPGVCAHAEPFNGASLSEAARQFAAHFDEYPTKV